MNKKHILFTLFVLLSYALMAQTPANKIHDPFFKNGFYVVTPNPAVDTVSAVLLVDSTATPVWTVRQYNSKFDLSKNIHESIANRHYFKVPGNGNLLAKSLTVNPVKGSLTLECNASAEYTGLRRSHQPWVYLTVDAPTDTISLARCNSLKLMLSYRVRYFEDCMGFLADSGFHGATFQIAFKLRNVNRESVSFGKSFRLVMVLFDNRYTGNPSLAKYSENQSPLGGNFAYYPSSNAYMPTQLNGRLPKEKQKVEMNVDLIQMVRKAIDNSISHDLISDTQIDDWEIVACDLGWEMTGTYNAAVQVKNLQLLAQ